MRLVNRVYRALIALVLIALLVTCGLAIDIWRYAGQSSAEPAGAALVLGAAVLWDRPSPVLAERLRHAKTLFERRQVSHIVVTGGRSPEDKLSEAAASRNWLVNNGIPDGAIIEENASRTTIENLALAAPILEQRGIHSILIVSDPMHMRRATLIANRLGISARPSPTATSRYQTWQTAAPFLAREVWLTLTYVVTGA